MKRLNILICLLLAVHIAKSQDYVISNYGVKADSTIMNTQAIQRVIDLAARKAAVP